MCGSFSLGEMKGAKKRRERTYREMKRSSEGIIMTKWQEDDRSMGHVYPQERESKRDGEESGGREATALWRVTLFTGRRRDWGILMWGGRRKMKGDSLGWRQPLWLWKEEGVMKQRNDEKGEGVTDRGDIWRKNIIVRGKREAKIQWEHEVHCTGDSYLMF